MKKVLSLLLAFTMVFTGLPSAVFAVSPNADLAYSGFFSAEDHYYKHVERPHTASQSNYSGGVAAINNAIAAVESSVNVASYGIPVSQLAAIFNNMWKEPAYFYLEGYSYSFYPDSKIVFSVTFSYYYTPAAISPMKAEYEAAISKALSWIKPGMSIADKVLVMHDYLVLNTKYDYGNFLTGTIPVMSHKAYGVLVKGVGVCDGYALAFKDLMTRLDIPVVYLVSNAMSHAWNMVKLNGKWYHIDVTQDDPVLPAANGWLNDDYDLEGRVHHNYFLLSDSAISALGHSGWAPTTYIANSTLYNGKYVNIKSGMFWHQGFFYYNSAGKLSRSRFDLSESSALKTVNGSVHNDNNYSYLSVFDDQIYYNYTDSSKTSINRINFDATADASVVTINTPVGGVTQRITELVIQGDFLKYTLCRQPSSGSPSYVVRYYSLVKRELLSRDGSTTVIDSVNGFIYGLETGLTTTDFENNFVRVTGNAKLEYDFLAGAFGTGTKVKLLDSATQEVLASHTIVIFGDVNGDGNTDSLDGSLMIDFENYLIEWDAVADAAILKAGDLNGDGQVDSIDAGIVVDAENYSKKINRITELVA
ncbi:MAG TPA: transglutaminase domain-containing protein [Clostridia bacterium]|nr:transglutaminase domain-containing protein [Clostridia bacterium]